MLRTCDSVIGSSIVCMMTTQLLARYPGPIVEDDLGPQSRLPDLRDATVQLWSRTFQNGRGPLGLLQSQQKDPKGDESSWTKKQLLFAMKKLCSFPA